MKPVSQLIRERFSCRAYLQRSIEDATLSRLREFTGALRTGPFGNCARICLVAGDAADGQSLKDLGTYGMIKDAQGFIVGAVGPGARNLEDFGYLMEQAVLAATDLGLGTCWLGGSFKKSAFGKKITATAEERVPAVVSLGYSADPERTGGWVGRKVGRWQRRPPEQMFFLETFDRALHPDHLAGVLWPALEAVRWGPSASNKQPWRVVKKDAGWHFYLQRTKGYGRDSFLGKLLGTADLQRLDMGIAMCHFELSARDLGLTGRWELAEPDIQKPDDLTEYTATWRSGS